MLGHGGSSAGSYLADPTSPIPSHCAVITPVSKCPSASIVVTSTVRVKNVHVSNLSVQNVNPIFSLFPFHQFHHQVWYHAIECTSASALVVHFHKG